jgi:murein DD-endopeptidase MepM/ murein hydrolase activator NlpD
LSETSLAPAGPPRHGLVEGLLGGAVALVAITVAHASLPDFVQTRPPALKIVAPPPASVAPPRAPPPEPPVLIAFAPPLPDGDVGSPFGLRQLPWENQARLHAGVDMVAPAPEPVLASADGVVIRVGTDAGYGRFVELKHAEGMTTLYGHLDNFASGIAPGAAVKAGKPVGRLGNTGASTGVHLHFEVHDAEDRPLNPEVLLGHAYARAADIPLREARRVPRRVRVAYVSRIPRNKRAEMQAKLADEAAAQASDDADSADESPPTTQSRTHGRPRMRIRLRS